MKQLMLDELIKPSNLGVAASERTRLEYKYAGLLKDAPYLAPLVTYVPNKRLPLLRLYRFKEAFSASLVEYLLKKFEATKDDYLLDPFAGMGTSLLVSALQGIRSLGIDRLPIAAFVADTLPEFFSLEQGQLADALIRLQVEVGKCTPAPIALDVPLMKIAFEEETLTRLRQWKSAIDSLEEPLRSSFLLLFFSILGECSYGSNDGQFIRIKHNKKILWPDKAITEKVYAAERDIAVAKGWFFSVPGQRPKVILGDSRQLDSLEFPEPPTLVITSPPYLNRYDYTRSYCLELCFHFVANFQELKALRHSILRSHIESRLGSGELPVHPAIAEVLDSLKAKELNNPRIPHMICAYFTDMAKVINGLGKLLAADAHVAMVVDNVRFEGEAIPVDLILSDIASKVGFEIEEILICRYKGNSSQQMRRYGRFPVRESIVVWRKR